jgi:hypothetical protein
LVKRFVYGGLNWLVGTEICISLLLWFGKGWFQAYSAWRTVSAFFVWVVMRVSVIAKTEVAMSCLGITKFIWYYW